MLTSGLPYKNTSSVTLPGIPISLHCCNAKVACTVSDLTLNDYSMYMPVSEGMVCGSLVYCYSLLSVGYRLHNNKLKSKIIINKLFCGMKVVLMCFCKWNGVRGLLGDAKTWVVVSEWEGHTLPPEMLHHGRLLTLFAHQLPWEEEVSTVWEWVSCVLACAEGVHVKERDRKSLWVCVCATPRGERKILW